MSNKIIEFIRNPEEVQSLHNFGGLNTNQVRDITTLFRLTRRVRFEGMVCQEVGLRMVALKRRHFERNCTDECAICLESHIKGETILTDCRHKFGLKCWTEWLGTQVITSRGRHITRKKCPACNKANPRFIAFSMIRDGSPAWTSENLAEHKELFRRIFEEEDE
jgi:hypothetical protein